MGVHVQRFALPTSTGPQSYTISGIGTPKAAAIFYHRADTNATAKDDAAMGVGFTDGTRDRACSFFSNHANFAEDVESQSDNAVIYVRDEGGNVIQDADFSQWVTDGIELTHNTVDGSNADFIEIVFFVGANYSVHCNQVSLDAEDTGKDVTDPGFEPDVVLVATIGRTTHPTTENDAYFSFGVAANNGTGFDHGCWAYREKQNISVGQPLALIDDRYAAANISISSTAYDGAIELSSPDSSGFTATGRTANTTGQIYFYLAIKLPAGTGKWVGLIDTPTATGSKSYTDPGFTPQFLGWGFTHLESTRTVIATNEDAGSNGVGFAETDTESDGVVTDGLIGWYKFDEGSGQVLGDSSGNGNDGELGSTSGSDTNDPTWTTDGGETVLDFDGTDDYITIDSLTPSGDKTIQIVARTTVPFVSGNMILVGHSGSELHWLYFRENTGRLRAFNGTEVIIGPSINEETDWGFYSLRQTGSTGKVSINAGTPVEDTSWTAQDFSGGVRLGEDDSSNPLEGQMAYALIYNRHLSDAEELQNYNAIRSAKPGLSLPKFVRSYAGSWQQEDGSASTDCQSYNEDVPIVAPDDDGTVGYRATFTSFDANGWTVNFTAVKAAAKKTFAWAIEEEAAAPVVVGPPVSHQIV